MSDWSSYVVSSDLFDSDLSKIVADIGITTSEAPWRLRGRLLGRCGLRHLLLGRLLLRGGFRQHVGGRRVPFHLGNPVQGLRCRGELGTRRCGRSEGRRGGHEGGRKSKSGWG